MAKRKPEKPNAPTERSSVDILAESENLREETAALLEELRRLASLLMENSSAPSDDITQAKVARNKRRQ